MSFKTTARRRRWQARRTWDRIRAPWPIVGECHRRFEPGHSCPQHDPHQHDWVAWLDAPAWVTSGPGTPVRCRLCGGRKCDMDPCTRLRHDGHGHAHEAA
jgi:hypothetical protein